MAVGAMQYHGGADTIPGPSKAGDIYRSIKKVELFVEIRPMTKVFSHDTSGGLFSNKAEALRKNPETPAAKLFSILGDLEDFRSANGSFHLKICYPELTAFHPPCNEWIQTSNPATESTIQGFRAISLAFPKMHSGAAWGGLRLSPHSSSTLIDGTYGWWMAVGAMQYHGGADTIPGPSKAGDIYRSIKKVELFVVAEESGNLRLVTASWNAIVFFFFFSFSFSFSPSGLQPVT
jgi:hypothetical protein